MYDLWKCQESALDPRIRRPQGQPSLAEMRQQPAKACLPWMVCLHQRGESIFKYNHLESERTTAHAQLSLIGSTNEPVDKHFQTTEVELELNAATRLCRLPRRGQVFCFCFLSLCFLFSPASMMRKLISVPVYAAYTPLGHKRGNEHGAEHSETHRCVFKLNLQNNSDGLIVWLQEKGSSVVAMMTCHSETYQCASACVNPNGTHVVAHLLNRYRNFKSTRCPWQTAPANYPLLVFRRKAK